MVNVVNRATSRQTQKEKNYLWEHQSFVSKSSAEMEINLRSFMASFFGWNIDSNNPASNKPAITPKAMICVRHSGRMAGLYYELRLGGWLSYLARFVKITGTAAAP
jgi:hypothetical protein